MAKIAVFAGHGGSDSGAQANGVNEKDVNLNLSTAVTKLLRNAGYTVINNRTSDVDRNIRNDAQLANRENVDAVVELHMNSNAGTPSRGSEVFYSAFGDGKGKTLAEAIQDNIVALGFYDRGIKTSLNSSGQDALGIIRQTKAPAVLVEPAFLNNPDDMARFNVDSVAKAVSDAVMQVFPISAPGGGDSTLRQVQNTLNSRYGTTLSTDGIWGNQTKAAIVKGWQTELNQQFGRTLATDGIWGPATRAATVTLRPGAAGNMTYLLQSALYGRGYRNAVPDGIWGDRTSSAVMAFQNDNGLRVDGIAGAATQSALFR